MRTVRFMVIGTLVLLLFACSRSKKDKLVGRWEGADGSVNGTTLEFTGDGKFKVAGQERGTFEVDGDNLRFIAKHPEDGQDVPARMVIKSLTDSELVTEDDHGRMRRFRKE